MKPLIRLSITNEFSDNSSLQSTPLFSFCHKVLIKYMFVSEKQVNTLTFADYISYEFFRNRNTEIIIIIRFLFSLFCSLRQLLFSCPLGSWVSLWNFETIRGSLMKPKWQKLASLAQEICTL